MGEPAAFRDASNYWAAQTDRISIAIWADLISNLTHHRDNGSRTLSDVIGQNGGYTLHVTERTYTANIFTFSSDLIRYLYKLAYG